MYRIHKIKEDKGKSRKKISMKQTKTPNMETQWTMNIGNYITFSIQFAKHNSTATYTIEHVVYIVAMQLFREIYYLYPNVSI